MLANDHAISFTRVDHESRDTPPSSRSRPSPRTRDHGARSRCAGRVLRSDYRNETPAHPERSFTGREQVRRNWEQILALVPDITATVIRYVVDGEDVWSEWEHRGSRRDGSEHLMRGVIIFRVVNDAVASARFYIEPVQAGGGDVEAAVRRQVMAPPSTPPPAPRS